jgi:hypothetical protein
LEATAGAGGVNAAGGARLASSLSMPSTRAAVLGRIRFVGAASPRLCWASWRMWLTERPASCPMRSTPMPAARSAAMCSQTGLAST